ncbi:U6 small nuclear RNA (adenine-(43)-N(6))-methyltransferase [Halyomorpha halys]|uniref:U6 small nuclear RNA (adenine-(43)-N(6))-methyltransferase n=1 Tax=Halyomorpha halys TaxID=286706 RepID=UPI0006D4DA4A|nr:U6 small nuclear RNA (adenine-(43)-N(6))-methyltransferase [Halyomorpha halys]
MAMNKLMHPRNPYKKRPDFKKLAIDYPDFRKYAKQDLSGKINFNFKDHGAVWALTKCLLQRDFGLNVEIVPGHLVPTLPLRLNYLLWIEDLLELYRPKNVIGIDIGTGSNCIYPLLAAKKFNWSMLCTEIDVESTKCAIRNVENNYLIDKISVKAVTEDVILDGAIDEDTFYDFCMCNPPFFADSEELSMESKSRSPSRKPPNNAPSGVPSELITPGGESVFIARIIADSCILQERVRIYTVMVGKKSTLKPLKEMLRENEACSIATTMFCQGRTTRWGLAWTFIPGLDLNQVENSQKTNKQQSYVPFLYRIEKTEGNTLKSVQQKLVGILNDLQIETDLEDCGNSIMITVKAFENTWINSRRKRRMKKKETETSNTDTSLKSEEQKSIDTPSCQSEGNNVMEEDTSKPSNGNEDKQSHLPENPNQENDSTPSISGVKRTNPEEPDEQISKLPKLEEYLVASLMLKDESDEFGVLTLELYFIEGTGGREGANQLLTYLKNRLK